MSPYSQPTKLVVVLRAHWQKFKMIYQWGIDEYGVVILVLLEWSHYLELMVLFWDSSIHTHLIKPIQWKYMKPHLSQLYSAASLFHWVTWIKHEWICGWHASLSACLTLDKVTLFMSRMRVQVEECLFKKWDKAKSQISQYSPFYCEC